MYQLKRLILLIISLSSSSYSSFVADPVHRSFRSQKHLKKATELCLGNNIISVTRFDEILPLWQKLRNIWQYFKGLFGIWQICETTLEQFLFFWANYFHCCKWPNLEKTIWPYGHTEDNIKTTNTHSLHTRSTRLDHANDIQRWDHKNRPYSFTRRVS